MNLRVQVQFPGGPCSQLDGTHQKPETRWAGAVSPGLQTEETARRPITVEDGCEEEEGKKKKKAKPTNNEIAGRE